MDSIVKRLEKKDRELSDRHELEMVEEMDGALTEENKKAGGNRHRDHRLT